MAAERLLALVAHLGDLVAVLGIAGADGLLVVLADAGARDLVNERPPLWQPPPSYIVRQKLSQLTRIRRSAFFEDHNGQRPLLPTLVGYADDRGLDHIRVPDQAVLQLDRRDPLPA